MTSSGMPVSGSTDRPRRKNTPTTREPRRESLSSENYLLKAQQAEQLRTLRYKMHQHRQHLDELDRFM